MFINLSLDVYIANKKGVLLIVILLKLRLNNVVLIICMFIVNNQNTVHRVSLFCM